MYYQAKDATINAMRKRIKNSLSFHLYTLVFLQACLYSASVNAQSSLLETKVTIQQDNKALTDVLDVLVHEYNIPFSYFKNQLPLHKKVSINLQNEPLQRLLDQVSSQAGIQYQAIGGQIVLKIIDNPSTTGTSKPNPAKSISSPYRTQTKHRFLFLADNSRTTAIQPSFQEFFSSKKSLHENNPEDKISIASTKLTAGILTVREASLHNKFEVINSLSDPHQPFFLTHTNTLNSISLDAFPFIQASKPVYINSRFQLALVPGLSTHGIHPGEYTNIVSINLLAGYSAGNKFVEIGGLSNFNQNHVFGLQMSGLANVIGGNKFVGLTAQEKQKLKKENTESNLQGFQVAGLTNIIAGNVFGLQTTGGINIVQKSLQGVQLAGVSNLVKTYTFGIQLAGISNASMESVDGLQIASLYNYTDGELHGIQLSAFNQAGEIEGKRSLISVNHTGLQIGLVNTTRRMNGFQIGLVNIGGDMAGTQIGFINLNAGKYGKGVPIGLFNLNTKNEFVRLYTSELFASNLEISTGSLRIQNMVSFGYNVLQGSNFYQPKWSIGYSIGQIKWPRKEFFYSYDAGIAHINQHEKLTKQLSLLTRARATAGYKITLQKVVFHVFGGLTFNTFIANKDRAPLSPDFLRIYHTASSHSNIEMWPGFVAGIHL
jgi:hypothetical protein